MKVDEMGGACNTPEGGEQCTQSCQELREHFGDLGVDGRIILKWILSI
jgi:hypothetical protein